MVAHGNGHVNRKREIFEDFIAVLLLIAADKDELKGLFQAISLLSIADATSN